VHYLGSVRALIALGRLIIALAALLLLRPGTPLTAAAGGGGDVYVPGPDELNAWFTATLSGYTVTPVPGSSDEWDAVGHYSVQYGGESPEIALTISASVLATSDEARQFYQSVAQRLEIGNNSRRGGDRVEAAREYGVDELRAFFRIYTDPAGHRVSSYAHLGRAGRVVMLVEANGDPMPAVRDVSGHHPGVVPVVASGDPAPDDGDWVANDRALVLVRTFDLVVEKLHGSPALP